MTVAFVSHSDCGTHDTGWNHPEHVGRLRAITRALHSDPELFMSVVQLEGRHATQAELELAHTAGYLRFIQALAESGGGQLDAESVVSPGSWDAARAAAGSVLAAVDAVMAGVADRAFCAVRPPGHHAVAGGGMGFCLVGNVAVAALYARSTLGLERVLIVDWDVHHGNGTQDIVQHDAGIRFVSMHQWPWYPGSGATLKGGPLGNVWNIPMAPGLPRQDYLAALENGIVEATVDWVPQLVLVYAGFDCLAGDPLGGFTLTVDDVAALTRMVTLRADRWCSGRVVSVLEGGYEPDALGEAALVHLRALGEADVTSREAVPPA